MALALTALLLMLVALVGARQSFRKAGDTISEIPNVLKGVIKEPHGQERV